MVQLSPAGGRLSEFNFSDLAVVVKYLNAAKLTKVKAVKDSGGSLPGHDSNGRCIGEHKGCGEGCSKESEQGLKAAITKSDVNSKIAIAGDMLKISKPGEDDFIERIIEWNEAFHTDAVGTITKVVGSYKGSVTIMIASEPEQLILIENPALPAEDEEELEAPRVSRRPEYKKRCLAAEAQVIKLTEEIEELQKQAEPSTDSSSFDEGKAQKALEGKMTIDALKPIFAKLFPNDPEPTGRDKKKVMVTKLIGFIITQGAK